jgi:ornithine cyclodeaminase
MPRTLHASFPPVRVVSEAEVEGALRPVDVVAAVERALSAAAEPEATAEVAGRRIMPAAGVSVAGELGGVLATARGQAADGAALCVFGPDARPLAVIEAHWLTRLSAAAAAAAAVRRVAPSPPARAAVIGSGPLARAVAGCLQDALGLDVRHGPPSEAQRLVRDVQVVVTAARTRDPVVRDDWLAEGTMVAALGAVAPGERELDYRTLVRASLVLCDSCAEARRRSADLIETVEAGHLDWLEVHELAEAFRGELEELVRPADVVVYKGIGSPALVLAAAAPLLTSAT